MNPAESFSADYQEARQKFRAEAHRAGGALDSVTHPLRGPDAQEIATDIAWFGPRNADDVLVLISGTHGVEGFCGSGAQVDLLRRGRIGRVPKAVAVMMVHAINPYGFAWLRRVTHENIDLNRNWVDFSKPLPANPGYEELSAVISPDEWTEPSIQSRKLAEAAFAARHGAGSLGQALSGGQYTHPEGIHFGGAAASWSRLTQTQVFEAYLGQAGRIGIIDVHSGLGPWGCGERIVTEPRTSAGFQRAARWYGAAVTSTHDGSASSASLTGDGLSAASSLLPHAEVTTMALEFGTLSIEAVHEAVCGDAWLHAHGEVASAFGEKLRWQTRDAFYCDTDTWKGMVVGQSLTVCRQAIASLSASSPRGAS